MKKIWQKIKNWFVLRWKELKSIHRDKKEMKMERQVRQVEFHKKHPTYTIVTRILCVIICFVFFVVCAVSCAKAWKKTADDFNGVVTAKAETFDYSSSTMDGVSAYSSTTGNEVYRLDVPSAFIATDYYNRQSGEYSPYYPVLPSLAVTRKSGVIGFFSDYSATVSSLNSYRCLLYYHYNSTQYMEEDEVMSAFVVQRGAIQISDGYYLSRYTFVYPEDYIEDNRGGGYAHWLDVTLTLHYNSIYSGMREETFDIVIQIPWVGEGSSSSHFGACGFIPNYTVSGAVEPFGLGYLNGYDEGYSVGNQEGYDVGYQEGDSAGYIEGFSKGETSGWNNGYSFGWDQGYYEGVGVALEDVTPWEVIVDGVNKFFGLSFLGSSVTIGMIMSIGFGVILFGFAIKIFLGG